MRWYLLLVGALMVIYLIGGLLVGQLGFSVVLGDATAWATHISRIAATEMWTAIYILITALVLFLGYWLDEK